MLHRWFGSVIKIIFRLKLYQTTLFLNQPGSSDWPRAASCKTAGHFNYSAFVPTCNFSSCWIQSEGVSPQVSVSLPPSFLFLFYIPSFWDIWSSPKTSSLINDCLFVSISLYISKGDKSNTSFLFFCFPTLFYFRFLYCIYIYVAL